MKAFVLAAAAASVLGWGLPGQSLAQNAAGVHRVRYDAQTVWTVSGKVVSLDGAGYGQPGDDGVHILLKTARGELAVLLGPGWFLDRQSIKVAPHDVIEVTGSPVIRDGKPALIAAELTKGSERLRLRTAGGIPLWSRAGTR